MDLTFRLSDLGLTFVRCLLRFVLLMHRVASERENYKTNCVPLEHRRLSSRSNHIDDARRKREGLAISGITLLELATLTSKGRLRLGISLKSFLQEVEAPFVVPPMSGQAATGGETR